MPGRSRAEGKEKGKGVVVRQGLEEAQSESARRRTGTGYEVWHTQDELARDNEVLHLRKGVLYKSGVYAWKVLCLTPGDLFPAQQIVCEMKPGKAHPEEQGPGIAGVADCYESRVGDTNEASAHKRLRHLQRQRMRRGAEVSRGHSRPTTAEGPNGSPERGLNERRNRLSMNRGIASAPDETAVGERGNDASVVRNDWDDLINRTARYVIRMPGGVGGVGP